MNRDRLASVLRVRELVERQRLAERAAADRAAAKARDERTIARERRDAAGIGVHVALAPAQLAAHRLGGLALDERVATFESHVVQADIEVVRTERARVDAAVARCSVERLRERRAAAAARAAARREQRRSDDAALQAWRRNGGRAW